MIVLGIGGDREYGEDCHPTEDGTKSRLSASEHNGRTSFPDLSIPEGDEADAGAQETCQDQQMPG